MYNMYDMYNHVMYIDSSQFNDNDIQVLLTTFIIV